MSFNSQNCPICKRNENNYVVNAYGHLWEYHKLVRKILRKIEELEHIETDNLFRNEQQCIFEKIELMRSLSENK